MGLGLRAAARELGISHVALGKAEKAGRVSKETDGTFDVAKCRIALQRNSNPEQQRRARTQQRKPNASPAATATETSRSDDETKPPEESQAEALRQQAWLKVERDKLELEVKKKNLIELAPINAYVAGMVLKARDELTKIGPELRDQLSQEQDPIRCEQLISGRVERALAVLSEYRPSA
jgi:hypothetical protein